MTFNYDIPLSNDWIAKGFKAIFKELKPDERLKKINMNCGLRWGRQHKYEQYIVCIAEPTNRYFSINSSEVFVRKRFNVTKDQKTLLKSKG